MFPIQDAQGSVIAFGGRRLDEKQDPKYLNSADSFLYHKSKTVYGLHFAKAAIRKLDEVVLVEGYMDALSLWQAGIENAVAPLGTALTPDHLRILSRYTKNMVLSFDGDEAGRKAAFRSLPLFLELELTPKALLFPENEDPDSFIRKNGKGAWEELKQKAPTLVEALIEHQARGVRGNTQAVLKAWESLRPFLAAIRNPVEAGIYRKKIAEQLGVEESWLKSDPKKSVVRSPQSALSPVEGSVVQSQFPQEEQLLIAAMLLSPETIPAIQEAAVEFTHPRLKKFSTQLFERYAEENSVSLAAFSEELEGDFGRWVREIALIEEEAGTWKKVVADCLSKKEGKNLGTRIKQLNEKIIQAESTGDEEELFKLITQKRKLLEEKHYGGTGKGN
ncbi:MAG: toprim domain-containing protein [Deltaproteobacteria bacterium]|nr:toprim domain-containing protein [Deltaproteobacteria bacterium]